jgi:2'-deoxynucleoside 5'-phosphate N-hydrolase
MKIYFAGSIRGGRDDQALYAQLIDLLRNYGTVLTEHFAEKSLTAAKGSGSDVQNIYDKDMAWVNEADVIIAEVTTPSLGVGFEIGAASQALKKPILCLYRPQEGKSLSAMIAGCPDVANATYKTIDDIKPILDAFFAKVSVEKYNTD